MTHTITNKTTDTSFDSAEDESILDAALRQGIVFPYSCRNGSCASCKSDLISGDVDYGEFEEWALSQEEIEQGKVLLCQAKPKQDIVIEAREVVAAEAIQIKTLPCRVTTLEKLADDVMHLSLRLPQGQSLNFLAGQYIDILLRDGRRRSFSLASRPAEDQDLQLHVRQVPNGRFTQHVFDGMKQRDLLRFQGPLGTFFLRDSNRPVILMAGGTGFAPIKSILEQAFAENSQRRLHLFWGARARKDLYLHDLASGWAAEHANFHYTPVLSEALPEDAWQGATGFVHETVVATYPELAQYEVYASGPPPMIEAGKAAFSEHGLSPEQLFYDSFEFASDAG